MGDQSSSPLIGTGVAPPGAAFTTGEDGGGALTEEPAANLQLEGMQPNGLLPGAFLLPNGKVISLMRSVAM
jgi:hypothetical protein